MTETWLFGEMDLDLSKDIDTLEKKTRKIAEACGYAVERMEYPEIKLGILILQGADLERIIMVFNTDSRIVEFVDRWQYTDNTSDGSLVAISNDTIYSHTPRPDYILDWMEDNPKIVRLD